MNHGRKYVSVKYAVYLLGGAAAAAGLVAGARWWRRWQRAPFATGRVEMLDVAIDALTMAEVLARVEGFIRDGGPHHIVTADASGVMQAQDDPALLGIMQQAALVTPDGAGVLLAARMRGVQLPARVSGVDLARVMIESQKASVSFRALTEVRNRLVTVYQDIMNMSI